MSNVIQLTFPPGRLVWGSMELRASKDQAGQPKLIKSGDKAGQPLMLTSFGYAIPKGAEGHWGNTEWGKQIWGVGHTFPGGAAQRPDFAWKILDGDSTLAKKGKTTPINQLAGHAGHWVLSFSTSLPINLYKLNAAGKPEQLLDPKHIETGYWIQVHGSVDINNEQMNPGVYLNPFNVCLVAYDTRISNGADPDTLGFGTAGVGATASFAPPSGFNPASLPAIPGAAAVPSIPGAPVMPTVPVGVAPVGAPAIPTAPSAPAMPGAPAIPAPAPVLAPVPAARVLVATPGAAYTIEQCRAGGWTDDQIVQSGYASWSTPVAAPAAPAMPAAPAIPAAGVQPVPSFLNGPTPG